MKILYTHDVPHIEDIDGRNLLLKKGMPAVEIPDDRAQKLIARGMAQPASTAQKPVTAVKAEVEDDDNG